MIPAMVDQAPFIFGWPELLFTGVAAGIIIGIIGPRWWRARKKQG
jgi:hypothetical protein